MKASAIAAAYLLLALTDAIERSTVMMVVGVEGYTFERQALNAANS